MTRDVIIGAIVLVIAIAGVLYFAGMQPPTPNDAAPAEQL